MQDSRSQSRGAPALILAAHGERGVPDANRALLEHTEALAARATAQMVGCGVLNGEPSFDAALEQAAEGGAGELLIYPFFMSDGYFAGTALPERIAACGVSMPHAILPPLGHDPGLARLMLDEALAAAGAAGFRPSETRLLVVGHGSKSGDPAPAAATVRIVGELEALARFSGAAAAFIEEPPFAAAALAAEEGPVVVSGFFAGNGTHSSRDVPETIARSGARAVYAGPVGVCPAVRGLILEAVARHGAETQ